MPEKIIERALEICRQASNPIPADQFIPRFLSAEEGAAIASKGSVGVRAFDWTEYTNAFSPYLVISDIRVNPPLMFPDHPHCGHDMMMYILDGEFTHEDFMGWKETFGKGDLHWMGTGKGIIHAQIPGPLPSNRHVQFWINLPKDKKDNEPSNQVLRANQTEIASEGDATCRLLVGKYGGKESHIKTSTDLLMMDVTISGKANIELPASYMTGIYILSGSGKIANNDVSELSICLSKPIGGDAKTILSCEGEMRFLIFAGEPINEPLNVDGFFVCCNKEDTDAAVKDFDNRDNAFAGGKTWHSAICRRQH